jgi:hypothetical protein
VISSKASSLEISSVIGQRLGLVLERRGRSPVAFPVAVGDHDVGQAGHVIGQIRDDVRQPCSAGGRTTPSLIMRSRVVGFSISGTDRSRADRGRSR